MTRDDPPASSRWGRAIDRRLTPAAGVTVLLLCLAAGLAVPFATLPLHVSWDYGEGWNAYWAARAMAGAPLYTDAASPITNNYPPLSFYLFGLAGRLAGDQIVGGRLLALAALAACAGMTGMLAARLGATRGWAAASGGALLLYVASFAWRYVATDDPQWPAAAFTLAALLLLCTAAPPSAPRLVGAALLLVTGGLIKHNQLAAPIAITLWLAWSDRRGLIVWIASGALFAGTALLVLQARFGPLLFAEVLHHQRVFKGRYLVGAAASLAGLLPMMGLSGILWRRRPRDQGARPIILVLLFAAVATLLGILQRFGTGVSVNAHFDAAIGLAAAAGAALGRPDILSPPARRRMAALVLVPLLVATLTAVPRAAIRLATLGDTAARWRTAIAEIRGAPGPVACELPAYCFWADRPFLVDFFNYGQKMWLADDPAGLNDAIVRQRFALMVVVHDRRFREGDSRLPDGTNRAIAAAYRIAAPLPDNALLLRPAR